MLMLVAVLVRRTRQDHPDRLNATMEEMCIADRAHRLLKGGIFQGMPSTGSFERFSFLVALKGTVSAGKEILCDHIHK